MADKGVLVEINLTSNADILGVTGKHHPLATYRSYGVPVALSTDDPGIERIDLTHEYVRAVETYGLSYADLKELVRNSIEYSFPAGAQPVGRPRRLCALHRRVFERGSGQG
jgi:adenosine deaminase